MKTRCESGTATGVRCEGIGVTEVEWMPNWLRASHEAAGNSGIWPHNGAVRLMMCPECAEELLADREWCSAVV